MKNRIISMMGLMGSVLLLQAQATLPTSWNMDNAGSPPTGYTTNLNVVAGNLIYTGNGFFKSGPQALRLDGTGESLEVYFASKPDSVKFYFRNTGTGAFQGTFDVLESPNGSLWNTVKSYVDADVPNTMANLQSWKLNANSRYVKLVLSRKVSGYNISLDDVAITAAPPSTGPEIKVLYDGKELLNGAEIFVGNPSNFDVELYNRSRLSELNVALVEKQGADTSFFQLAQTGPVIIDTNSSYKMTINLVPVGPDGSKKATFYIYSNDTNNNPFTLNLYGIQGNLASEPSGQASNLQLTENKAWRFKVKFDAGVAERYLVLVKKGAITEEPVDGTVYQRGGYIGGARVMHAGLASEVNFDKIYAGNNYTVKVFAYNGTEGFENYLLTGALELGVSTPGGAPGAYYQGIDPTSSNFVGALRAKVRPHFQVFYSNYANTIIENFEAYDTTQMRRVLRCAYSNYVYTYAPPFRFDTMSREHVYPYSWMGESSQDSANYSDLHILFPVHQNSVNAIRSNYPMGNVKTAIFQFREGVLGTDSSGVTVYEPRDEAKGAAARAMFYICATYHRTGKLFTIPSSVNSEKQDQRILKRWNEQFPPNDREIARNEYIASVQNNRNPFVDQPNWACYIDFSNMSHVPSGDCNAGSGIAVKPTEVVPISAYPNPVVDRVELTLKGFSDGAEVWVYDMQGALVHAGKKQGDSYEIAMQQWASGMYLVVVREGDKEGYFKVVK